MKRACFSRIQDLERMISSGRMTSAEQAAGELEVSVRTIERDLESLRDSLGAEIDFNRGRGCYELTGDKVRLPALTLSAREIALLLIAERSLRLHHAAKLNKRYRDEIHPVFNMDEVRELARSIVFYRPFAPERPVMHEYSKLLSAILDRRRVCMAYKAAHGTLTERNVDPYYLVNNGGDWYVIGFCRLKNEIRTFALDRIYNPRTLEHGFAIPKDFKIDDYLEKGFGRMQGGKTEAIRIKLWGTAVAWIRRLIWHPSQKIEEKRDGSIILCLDCPMTDSLVRWVLQMGGNARVLAPASLKALVRTEAQVISANYR